jgi:hypothetical protein
MVDPGSHSIRRRGFSGLARAAIAATAIGPTLALLPVRLAPVAAAHTYPGNTTSHYVRSLSTLSAYNEGCSTAQEATEPATAVVILDFGPAARDITNGTTTYGAILWDASRTYRTTAQIREIARQFGRGFWSCSPEPGTDLLRLALGISSDSSMFDTAHGSAWGSMVDAVQSWYVSNGYASQVRAAGAADIELGFNATYAMVKRWGDAFSAASDQFYYDFGDASGCSTTSSDNSTTSCTGPWTQQQIWIVSWGIPAASAIPEIYSTTQRLTPNKRLPTNNNALAWQQISLYGARFQGGRPIGFAGSLTQAGSSSDAGTDLAPEKGWAYLDNAVSDDVRTSLNSLPWATDIKWGY